MFVLNDCFDTLKSTCKSIPAFMITVPRPKMPYRSKIEQYLTPGVKDCDYYIF